jgi:hypothetical protein
MPNPSSLQRRGRAHRNAKTKAVIGAIRIGIADQIF